MAPTSTCEGSRGTALVMVKWVFNNVRLWFFSISSRGGRSGNWADIYTRKAVTTTKCFLSFRFCIMPQLGLGKPIKSIKGKYIFFYRKKFMPYQDQRKKSWR